MPPDAKGHAIPDCERLTVALGQRSYDIVVGTGLLAQAGSELAKLKPAKRVVIVSDEAVAPLYLDPLKDSLQAAGFDVQALIVPQGEASKSFAQLESLSRHLLQLGLERKSLLLALGGGVVGDLTGFVAAITLRGLDFVQIPTSLLAQVDSSVGGKTGINTPEGKNLIGAFHQPRLVLADSGVLDSLPRRELLAGYAEVVKYGLIDDPDFFRWLEDNGAAVLAGDGPERRQAVLASCQAKARIVAEDEREQGRRALLNLGHTFGHALEAECGYNGKLVHGEAVAIGMVLAFQLSARMGLCPAEDSQRVTGHLAGVGLPSDLKGIKTRAWTSQALLAHMAKDKKVADGALTFILARGIGKAFVTQEVPLDVLTALLDEALAA